MGHQEGMFTMVTNHVNKPDAQSGSAGSDPLPGPVHPESPQSAVEAALEGVVAHAGLIGPRTHYEPFACPSCRGYHVEVNDYLGPSATPYAEAYCCDCGYRAMNLDPGLDIETQLKGLL